jgi:hypothetical protein
MNSNGKGKERFCGNCDSHNSYEYPVKVFCSTRFGERKDPIVETLGFCDKWNQVSQECYCVSEAKKANKSAARQR